MSITKPKLDDLLSKADSRYTLVILAAKRARQINNYYNNMRRQELSRIVPPKVEMDSDNSLTLAMEEIAEGKVNYERTIDGIK